MWLIRLALRRPISVMVLAVALFLGALFALRNAPADIFPSLGIPVIWVVQPFAGMAPSQYQWFVRMPYFAPFAMWPMISRDPRFADMNAMPVIQCESERSVRRKSEEVRILPLRKYPTARTVPK